MRRRDRGVSLLVALAFVVILTMLLGVAVQAYGRLAAGHRSGIAEEGALLEARGGVRWMAARLARGSSESLERTEERGTLKVRVAGERVEAEFAAPGGAARVSARWRRGAGIELDEWRVE
jgi:type II secretory pathway component PulK